MPDGKTYSMMWHGGSSYGHGSYPDDLEWFETLSELEREFDSRADSWNTYYPCVDRVPPDDGGPSAWVFYGEPTGDVYPDWVIEYGPRGGLHRYRA